ncbi:MAG: AbrB/MazE/SpoVT family DNA-binding domain-containing protein [Candidatus Latescibacteria bacterium]|nr:AbrB/MazE/SpoVT family DNA-binding domain-containing protein [Candidatus Latescibacterota bacterium]
MAVAKLTSKGQLVIPQAIRQYLSLQQGDSVDFIIQDNGEVVVRPATRDVRELKNILPKPKKAVSLEDMDRAVREGAGKSL